MIIMRIISSRIRFHPLHALLICLVSAAHVQSGSQSDPPAVVPNESVMTATAPTRPPPSATSMMPKPAGMSDAEYSRLLRHMRARQMTQPERDDFWQTVQKLWKQFMDRLKKAAQRFAAFFERLNRGPSARGGPSSSSPPATASDTGSQEDMFTRRVAKGDSDQKERRIRPEEHGLTAEGLPRTQWNSEYQPIHTPADRKIPEHIPRPPSPAQDKPVPANEDKEIIATAASKENEIRTGNIPKTDTSISDNGKAGSGIHVTDH